LQGQGQGIFDGEDAKKTYAKHQDKNVTPLLLCIFGLKIVHTSLVSSQVSIVV
jgi:hypothetical protein